MNTPYTQDQVQSVVIRTLAKVLDIDPGEISPHAGIAGELDADSLDFVELNEGLEKQLNIVLPKKGPLTIAGKITGDPARFYSAKTGLTPAGVELMPHSLARHTQLKPGQTAYEIFNATHVSNVVQLCCNILAALPEYCPECGHGVAKLSPAGRVVCGSCSAVIRPLNGDDAEERALGAYLKPPLALAA